MSSSIVGQNEEARIAKSVLGKTTEANRLFLDGGLTMQSFFQRIIDDPEARNRLITYVKAGMPKVNLPWLYWATVYRKSGHNSSREFIHALSDNFTINHGLRTLISETDFSPKQGEIKRYNFYRLTSSQLFNKLSDKFFVLDIERGTERLGFSKCPLWAAIQLRTETRDQKNQDQLFILLDSNNVLSLRRAGSSLRLSRVDATSFGPEHKWAVCRPAD